jgi:hypothetical protein
MENQNDPFEAVRAMMHENLERMGGATQGFLDMLEKNMRALPGANQEQISTFKEYVERQVASNRNFGERLLRAKDFPEALRIQAEYFQSQLRTCAEDAAQIGAKMAGSFKQAG